MTLSKIFLFCCLFLSLGIGIGSVVLFPANIVCGFFILGLIFISVFWGNKKAVIPGLIILSFSLGILRSDKPFFYPWEEAELSARISSEPRESEKSKIFKINNFLVITDKYADYDYGDKIIVKGKVVDGSTLLFPEIEVAETGGNVFYKHILGLKERFGLSLKRFFSPPKSEILSAMLLGDKYAMSSNLKEKLNISGVRHITAISGMHISLISAFLMIFFLWLGLSRSASFYFSVLFLLIFILMIGFPASAIRAGVMGTIYLYSRKIGRMNSASRALCFSGAIMLFASPSLVFDYGFYLSFLAVLGIISLTPVLQEKTRFFKNHSFLREGFFTAFSAYFFTLPFILYSFQQVSLIAVFSNVMIFPFLYFIMFFGFLFLILGMFSPALSWILFFPLFILISIFMSIVELFSKIPPLKIGEMNWFLLIFSYILIFFFAWRINQSLRRVKI